MEGMRNGQVGTAFALIHNNVDNDEIWRFDTGYDYEEGS
jgi:hypothetical protein